MLFSDKHFTLKESPLSSEDLTDFIECYNPKNRHERKETERFKPFKYDDLVKRDKVSLDIFWIKDESLEDTENLPEPDIIAGEIAENLQTAIEQFTEIYDSLKEE